MAHVKLQGNVFNTNGSVPAKGSKAPDFVLTGSDLADKSLKDFAGQTLVLNIFPSVDTGVCAASVRRFNQEAASLSVVKVLCISADLPFAHKRFCEAEGIKNVIPLSEMRSRDFGKAYGIEIIDGPLAGLLARTVIVIGTDGLIKYTQLVPEITESPDFDAVLKFLKS